MIDREARDGMAELLRHTASGQMSVGEAAERLPSESQDAIVRHQIDSIAEALGNDGPDARSAPPSPEERRQTASLILFLQSDCEYRYGLRSFVGSLARLLMSGGGVTALLALAAYGLHDVWPVRPLLMLANAIGAISLSLLLATALFTMLGILAIFFWGIITGEDIRCWPFYSRKELDEALRHPKLLCGGRHG